MVRLRVAMMVDVIAEFTEAEGNLLEVQKFH